MESIYKNWPKSTGFVSMILFAILFIWLFIDPYLNIYIWFFWLHLPILMVHQFEEYIFPGGFQNIVNIEFFKTSNPNFPLSNRLAFILNIGLWLLFILAAIVEFNAIWLPLITLIFNLGNGLGHGIFAPLKQRCYNPGFFSGLFLIIPFTTLFLLNLIIENLVSVNDIIVSLIIGTLLGATLPLAIGGNYLRNREK